MKKILASMMLLIATSVSANAEYKLFLNNPLGSGPDQVVRKLSQLVKDQSKINLTVVNQGAAGGLMVPRDFKAERLAVAVVNSSMLIFGPLIGDNEITKTYSIKDFNIIADLGAVSSLVYTHPDSGIKTSQDLLRVLPTIKNASIGIASQHSIFETAVLVNRINSSIPIITFKSHNEVAIQTGGKHITLAMSPTSTDSVFALAKKGDVHILGHTGPARFKHKDFDLVSISQELNIPSILAGSWLSITPGDSEEHRTLKTALLRAMQDLEVKKLLREAWPMGETVPYESIYKTAKDNLHLIKK